MNDKDYIWYIEYDTITLRSGTFTEDILLELGTDFSGDKHTEKSFQLEEKHYILNMGQGLMEIIKTLYSFFIVEEKLSSDETAKNFFASLVSLCKIQKQYSQIFIFYRLMSCLLRAIKFYSYLYSKIKQYIDLMDKNFFDNMKQVYLYLLQKYGQILSYQSTIECSVQISKLQRLIVHIINVITVFFNFPIKAIYIHDIMVYNEKCYQFKGVDQPNEEYEVICQQQIDPVLIVNNEDQEYYL